MKRGELLNRKLRKSAVLLIAALVAAVTLDPGLAAGTVLAAEAKNGIEAVPVTVDSDFSFVNGEEYIIVSAGSSNPYPFALKNSLKSSMRLYAGQVEYNEETGVLELTETGEDISDYIWEAVDADETNTRLKNRSTGKFFNFSSVSFSLADTGTVISAGYDGRIYLGATNGYDYYLSCRYFEYDNPADYYYGFATASSSSDAGGMAMSVYKVSCSHENSIFSRNAAVTCTEDGYDEYICQDCGKILKQNIVSATGHNFVNGKCTVCGIRNVWDGISATGWINGFGTASDPYLIESENNLAYLAAMVNSGNNYSGEYFLMTRDLDLDNHEWTSIGNATVNIMFAGIFDGGGHTISNIYIKDTLMPALFGSVGTSPSVHAEIKNLVIKGKNESEKSYAAGLIAQAGNVTVTNVGNEVDVTGRYYCGGIAGYQYNLTATISNCYNKGTVKSTQFQRTNRIGEGTGGLVGTSNGKLVINESYNLGDVTVMSDQYGNAGGLVGASGSSASVEVNDSYNYGQVNGGYSQGSIIGYGTTVTAENTYYLNGCAEMVNGNTSAGAGNAASYSKTGTLLSRLGTPPFIDGSYINEDFDGQPALTWEYSHVHEIDEITDSCWQWSEDYRSCTLNYICRAEGCYGKDNGDGTYSLQEEAEVSVKYDPEATCVDAGIRTYTAAVTLQRHEYSSSKVEEVDPAGHSMTPIEAKEATCETDGNIGYYRCGVCKKLFLDEEGTEETDKDAVKVKAKGHTPELTEAATATYRASGNSAYYTCSVCHRYFSDSEGKNEIEENSWILPKLESEFRAGDVNRDGVVDGRDAALLLRYIAGKCGLDAEQIFLGDYDGDEGTSQKDADAIRKYSLGIKD